MYVSLMSIILISSLSVQSKTINIFIHVLWFWLLEEKGGFSLVVQAISPRPLSGRNTLKECMFSISVFKGEGAGSVWT